MPHRWEVPPPWFPTGAVHPDVTRELHEARVVEVQQGDERVDPQHVRGPMRIAAGPALEH